MIMALQANALLSIEEVFNYLRSPVPDETDPLYTLVESLINRASDYCERYISNPIINKEITDVLDGNGACKIMLNHFPIQGIGSVLVAGVDVTADADFYKHGVLFLKGDGVFPVGRKNIEVVYTAGYGEDKDTIPQDLKHAALLMVHFWFKRDSLDYSTTFGESDVITGNAAGEVIRFPYAAIRILNAYRRVLI